MSRRGKTRWCGYPPLNQRLTPMIEGKVIYRSADAVPEPERKGEREQASARRDSFIVRVQLDEEDARHEVEGFRPTPGMPADVFIKTGERTLMEYILQPVLDSFSHAFRER